MSLTEIIIRADLAAPFEEVEPRLRAALKEEGFGVLTEIDIQATMKSKLDADYRRYVILGACNPPLAHKALSADEREGVLLPCNVVLAEREDGGTTVHALDPKGLLALADLPGLEEMASDAQARIRRALASLEDGADGSEGAEAGA